MTFLNAALLFGLGAIIIPPIVHLFNRRKFDVVDWAAMQFLQVAPKTRRKFFLEQFWLLLLRVVLIAALVLAFASPQISSSWFGTNAAGPRDVVILIDGSASMNSKHGERTAADAARTWASDSIAKLAPGDRVAIFQVKAQPLPIVGAFTTELSQAKNALELLTLPKGTADWPSAIQAAEALAPDATRPRSIIVLSDHQRYSWADEPTLAKWDLLKLTRDREKSSARIWVVNVDADRPKIPSNWSLDPIITSRAVAAAGREIAFRSAIRFSGEGTPSAPGKLQVSVDGQRVAELEPVATENPEMQPIEYRHTFTPGSHLLTFQLADDDMPADNRQDFALDVLPQIPVLIVDRGRGSEFLRDALAPKGDAKPAFAIRTIRPNEFNSTILKQDIADVGGTPRVLVWFQAESISNDQRELIEKYLGQGGSVLLTHGEQTDAAVWNRIAFRGGQGFLPARLVNMIGDESKIEGAPKPQTASIAHPALDVFREPLPGGLHTAYFPKRWKIDITAGVNGATGTTIATMGSNEPWLIERAFGKGRVVLSTVPFDNSWKTNLIRLPDFVRLSHELMYYLAGARSAERNLAPGQAIVFTPIPEELPSPITMQFPDGSTQTIPVKAWPAVIEKTTDPGAYQLTTPSGRRIDFSVKNDPREAVLTPCSDDDRAAIRKSLGNLEFITKPEEVVAESGEAATPREFWWLLLAFVLFMLMSEVWYTRKLSNRGEHNLPRTGE